MNGFADLNLKNFTDSRYLNISMSRLTLMLPQVEHEKVL